MTPEGLPLAYEVFDCNRTDVTTLDEIVERMREQYGHARRTWVMDRGMVSEDNLEMLREAEASYLVGTPKSLLKQFEQDLLEQDWEQVESGVEVKLRPSPDGENETFVLYRSRGRIEKERDMREKQRVRLENELDKLKVRIDAEQRALHNRSIAERRVGRLFQKYSRAARFFQVEISEHDLGLRPISHQKQDPAQPYILVCFLALVMWRTLQEWMHGSGLGPAPRKLLEEMAEIRSLDVVLPTGIGKDVRLRTVSKPEQHLAILLQQLELPLPNKPKSI